MRARLAWLFRNVGKLMLIAQAVFNFQFTQFMIVKPVGVKPVPRHQDVRAYLGDVFNKPYLPVQVNRFHW